MENKKSIKNKTIKWLIVFAMTLLILGTACMLVFIFLGSFMKEEELNRYYGMIKNGNNVMQYAQLHIWSDQFTLQQYKKTLWDTSDFWFYFWNSMSYSIPILLGTVIVSIWTGFAFAKFRFPFRKLLMVLFIVVMMIPYQVLIPPTLIVLNHTALVNTRSAVILPNIFTTFGTYLLYQYISGIPQEHLEAARLDGAGNIKILFKIILPQIKGGIISLAILNFIDTWNLVEQPLTFLKDEFKYPLSVALSYFQEQSIGVEYVCATVFLIPILLIFMIGKEYLFDGIRNSVVGK